MAGMFDALEINTSFYHPPRPQVTETWLKHVSGNRNFVFTAKLWRRFTHDRNIMWTRSDVTRFTDGMRPLVDAARLGALLVQFPWSFRFDATNRSWLARVADTFVDMPLVVEARHASWAEDEAIDFLETRRLSLCNIDQPTSKTGLGKIPRLTGSLAYYRFHGRNREAWFDHKAGRNDRYDYLYSEDEMASWVDDIKSAGEQADRVFVMNNNHYQGQAVVNALQLRARMEQITPRAPETLLQAYPVLKSTAVSAPGQRFLDF